MTVEELVTAARYRVHGEEIRIIAEASKDREMRRILLGIAEDYERMAKSMEAIAESDYLRKKRANPDGSGEA